MYKAKHGSARRIGRSTPVHQGQPGGLSFKPGHWRADAPGNAIEDTPAPAPPMPAPVNNSSGGRETSTSGYATKLRAATAANIAAHEAALAPRRWRPPET